MLLRTGEQIENDLFHIFETVELDYEEIEKKDFFNEIMGDQKNEQITVLVGPEGDFSIDEVRLAMAQGYESISLGESRLRTETAGLMAVTMAQISLRL